MAKVLVRPTSKGQVTIPKSMRKKLKLDSETFLDVTLEGNKIVFQPVLIKTSVGLREYADDQIAEFLKQDKITRADAKFLNRILGTSKYR